MPPSNKHFQSEYWHKHYTGFTWDEIKLIAAASRASQNWANYPDGFDSPDYGGLSEKISKRLTDDQIDLIRIEWPTTAKKVARLLARGHDY